MQKTQTILKTETIHHPLRTLASISHYYMFVCLYTTLYPQVSGQFRIYLHAFLIWQSQPTFAFGRFANTFWFKFMRCIATIREMLLSLSLSNKTRLSILGRLLPWTKVTFTLLKQGHDSDICWVGIYMLCPIFTSLYFSEQNHFGCFLAFVKSFSCAVWLSVLWPNQILFFSVRGKLVLPSMIMFLLPFSWRRLVVAALERFMRQWIFWPVRMWPWRWSQRSSQSKFSRWRWLS